MELTFSRLLRAAAILLCFVSGFSYSASWDKVKPSALKTLPTFSPSGLALAQTKSGMVAMALGLEANEDMALLAQHSDKQGNVHSRFQQRYRGLPVWGQHITVHEQANRVYGAHGRVMRGLSKDLDRKLNRSGASTLFDNSSVYVDQALGWVSNTTGSIPSDWTLSNIDISKQIYMENNEATVTYVVTFLAEAAQREPVRPTVIIQESDHAILKAWNGLAHANATGPGGNVKVGRYEYGTDYGYLDVTDTAGSCAMVNDNVYTVDLQNSFDFSPNIPFEFPCYENTTREANGAYSPLNDAHFFGGVVYNMYQDWFGLPPLNFQLALKVHFGESYDNAFWNGVSMVFGDGGSRFYPLVDLNVVSHEVSHGFTEQNSSLIYDGQSGGINEAFSDIAGEAAEYYMQGSVDWLIGSAITKTLTALRFFEDPTLDGQSIGHASDYYPGMDVHQSSGVFNRAYYLIANSNGWNPQQAFEIFVHANRFYWGPATNFEEGSCGVLKSTTDLGYNKVDVFNAFVTVGVYCPTDDTDSDIDGMGDGWELKWGLDPTNPSDALLDLDQDGVNNLTEFQFQSNPTVSDSDSDNLSDSDEIYVYGTSPILQDTDTDGMHDDYELQYGFDPLDPADAAQDLDGDGSSNLEEFLLNTDPTDPTDFLTEIDFYFESFESTLPRVWTTSNSGTTDGWSANTAWSSHGTTSYAATGLTENQSATLKISHLFVEGMFSFDYRISTDTCCESLSVYLDGAFRFRTSGTTSSPRTHQIYLEAGPHTIEFVYTKSGSVSSSDNTVWIDAFLFESQNTDVDNDGLPNRWEIQYNLNPEDPADASEDLDSDGATNLQEFNAGSNPTLIHSDTDGISDGDEINIHGTSPILADTDSDEMDDGYEISFGLDPLDPADAALDLDGDGYSNLQEYQYRTDPTDPTDFVIVLDFHIETFEKPLSSAWTSYSTSNTGGWLASTSWFTNGTTSFAASGLGDSESATLQFTSAFSSGILSFDYRVSTESCCDGLRVYVDGVRKFAVSGNKTNTVQLALSGGHHTIEFVFSKNSSISSYEDTVWIDSILFESDGTDKDNDGLPNRWELKFNLDPLNPADASGDLDGDGATNLQEFDAGSDPTLVHSDSDGISDGEEINIHGTSPILADTDGDTMNDDYEIGFGLDPLDPTDAASDLDGDGSSNLDEHTNGTDPSDAEDYRFPVHFFYETFEGTLPDGWVIESSGSAQWQFSNDWKSQGEHSLKAEGLAGYGNTKLRFSADFLAGRLSFDFRTRLAPCCHNFRLLVDGVVVYSRNSYSDFTTRINHQLTSGVHVIEFEFYNSGSSPSENMAWIDLVMFEADGSDMDQDGMSNVWEVTHDLDPEDASDRDEDADSDSLLNVSEYIFRSDPQEPDSDGDGSTDGAEVLGQRSSPTNRDSDYDGMWDGFEIDYGFDPSDGVDANIDSDGDELTNLEEFKLGTDPTDRSSVVAPLLLLLDSFEGDLANYWHLSGSNTWQTVSTWSSDGQNSIAVVNAPHYSRNSIEMTALFSGGTLSFDYRVINSYSSNGFEVYIDNSRVKFYQSGTGRDFIALTPGVHTIRFSAFKHLYYGAPSFYLDKLLFVTNETDDIDNDGMSNTWELEYGLDAQNPTDANFDLDGDGATNLQEFNAGSNPKITDSDGDTLSDGAEINIYGSDPMLTDSDEDELDDSYEVQFGLDPTDPGDAAQDWDGDGSSNLDEYVHGTDPTDPTDFIIPANFMALTFENDTLPAGWEIITTGGGLWEYASDWSSQGSRSLAARNLETGDIAILRFNGWTEAGIFHLDSRVRLLPPYRDLFEVHIDGVRQFVGNRYDDYESQFQYALAEGFHTIDIKLVRNNTSTNESTTWIDMVWFESNNSDVDNDGLPNQWELTHNLNPDSPFDPDQDNDVDGLTNLEEFQNGSSPRLRDSDGDGADDAVELRTSGTLLDNADSDKDGMSDGFEINYALDPLDGSDAQRDNDGDSLTNLEEFRLGTDPTIAASTVNPTLLWLDSFEDGPSPKWTLSTDRAHDWLTSSAWSSNGSFSLAQEDMPRYSQASAELTALFADGVFSYDYDIDSSNSANYLTVFLDGRLVNNYYTNSSGSYSLNLSAGVHTIRFVATHSYYYGSTSFYIDNVRFSISDSIDLDLDGLPNAWELDNGLDPEDPTDAVMDFDNDGLSNLQEYEANTDPNTPNIDLQITMAKLFDTNSSEVRYRVRVTNAGLVDANNVVVVNQSQGGYAMQFTLGDTSAMSCTNSAAGLNCFLPLLPAGTEETFDVRVVVGSPDKTRFDASVSADEVDYLSENNQASGEYAGSIQWLMLGLLSTLYWMRRRTLSRRHYG